MEDLDALAVAVDGHRASDDVAAVVAVLVRDEAASDGVVLREHVSEGGGEVVDDVERGLAGRGEEEALLDVVGGEH